jgi:hypothetical protein
MAIDPNTAMQVQPTSFTHLRKFAAGGYLYALLDAYENPTVPAKVQELGKERAVSLFLGEAEKKYWDLAPYLIVVDEPILEWLVLVVRKAPWGVFVLSKSGLETLRTHFRRFLIVQLPDGERWYFRYYDPRILPIYLSNCHTDELKLFFGPVRAFGIADTESKNVLLLHAGVGGRSMAAPQVSSGAVWRVRPQQCEALERAIRDDFEKRMIQHLQNLFPSHGKKLGRNGLLEFVRNGTKKAASYQITVERDLCQFLELMFILGSDFDKNPGLPWAEAILQDASINDPQQRAARLFEAAKQVLSSPTSRGPAA